MNRIAILSNAGSGRNRARSELLRVLDATSGVDHIVTGHADEVPGALTALLAREPALLAVNGGDGTVQAALTAYADLHDAHLVPAQQPAFAVLPAGSTNMTAHDLGCGGRMRRRVGDLLALRDRDRRAWRSEQRAPIAVIDDAGIRRLGFFFGMGTIVRGIEYWHERLHHGAGAGEWAAGAALARAAWGLLRRQPPFHEPAQIRIAAHAGGGALAAGAVEDAMEDPMDEHAVAFLLATTIRRLFLGLTPFWGAGEGPLAVTWVDDGAERFLRRLPALLTGRGEHLPTEQGYHGLRVDSLRLAFAESWVVDGEVFPAAESLTIAPAPAFEFLRLADDLAPGGRS